MTVQLQQVAPTEIEAESFKIISAEFGPHNFNDQTFRVIQRVIHATGDFSFRENMRFSPGAIERGIKSIQGGKDILTDVTMVAAGIGKAMLGKWGGKVICRVADPEIATLAAARKKTRSEVAIEMSLGENIGIIALARFLVLEIKELDAFRMWALSGSILLIALAILIVRYGHVKFPYTDNSD